MQINLLSDYRGVLTEETYYTAGQYTIPDDMPEAYAANLISNDRAVVVGEPKPRPGNQKTVITKRSQQLDDKALQKVFYESLDDELLKSVAKERGITVTWNMKRETILERLQELD